MVTIYNLYGYCDSSMAYEIMGSLTKNPRAEFSVVLRVEGYPDLRINHLLNPQEYQSLIEEIGDPSDPSISFPDAMKIRWKQDDRDRAASKLGTWLITKLIRTHHDRP